MTKPISQLNSDIIPIWQPECHSTHRIAVAVGERFNTRATHTGTLDPMAEGVIVVLKDDARYQKIELAGWEKEYEFKILLGLATDSYDGMGFITEQRLDNAGEHGIESAQLENALQDWVGSYVQKVPILSAIKYKSKKLFTYIDDPQQVEELPEKKGQILAISVPEVSEFSLHTAVSDIISRVRSIEGVFRQEKIISAWDEFLNVTEDMLLPLVTVRCTLTRGMYVRSLSQEICALLGVPGFVFKLVRVRNGSFTRENSLPLGAVLDTIK